MDKTVLNTPNSGVVTRFAPSPTGMLHIGSARTALFNYLFAKHHGGKFLLRVEDTDRERSTPEATQAILDSMRWLDLQWDGEVVYQFARAARHHEVAHMLVQAGKAYFCYATQDELNDFRDKNPNAKFRSRWRDGGVPPAGVAPTIRLRVRPEGTTTVNDAVQGTVTVQHAELDDMVLLRSDGTPTYMLAVVVDDHDMGVTNIIRGDDHFTNSFRQWQIYHAMGWAPPAFAHIPLIHGMDGAKLSKRHGALGVSEYQKMGYLPEAVCNYLLRLGWSHGDDEIISRAQAIEWFGLDHVGKSPSRFDFAKLENLNGHYIREAKDERLLSLLGTGREAQDTILRALPSLKQRAKTLVELADNARFYIERPTLDDAAKDAITKGKEILAALLPELEKMTDWNHDIIQAACKAYAETSGQKLGAIMSPIRAAITGKTASPSMFEVMEILGKQESLARLQAAA